MNRRKLFGFAAAAPVAVIGMGAQKASANDAPEASLMDFTMGGGNHPLMRLNAGTSKEMKKTVGFGIGNDGHLWLKVNDDWKRVNIE